MVEGPPLACKHGDPGSAKDVWIVQRADLTVGAGFRRVAPGFSTCRIRLVTHDTEFVAVEIPKIRAVVVGVIVRPQTGRPFTAGACGESQREGPIDGGSVTDGNRHHASVAGRCSISVERRPDEKERATPFSRLPDCQLRVAVGMPAHPTKFSHQDGIE